MRRIRAFIFTCMVVHVRAVPMARFVSLNLAEKEKGEQKAGLNQSQTTGFGPGGLL